MTTATRKNKNKKEHAGTQTRKIFKKSVCSPSRRGNRYSCYNDKELTILKDMWNKKHPDVRIAINDPKEIWSQLKEKLGNVCNSEICWMRQQFAKNNLDSSIFTHIFAPTAPKTWHKNPNEWLNSSDITQTMRQWEHIYPTFEFIGPSPIDFDAKDENDSQQCIWNKLCNFSLHNQLKRRKLKTGMIFNLDPHYKTGSHWVALFLDIKKNSLFYFDSNGDKIPKQIKILVDRIIEQGKKLNMSIKFDQNHPVEHQKGNTECGIYCLYTIIQLLTGKRNIEYFMTGRIPDSDMFALRNEYFNI
tara:strand:- start:685 stop:1590 length:906 start_codon:yes stop_codon:yes gene_type:complete